MPLNRNRTLEAVGCEVVRTTHGSETVDLAFLVQPDVIVGSESPGVYAALERPVSADVLTGLIRRFREFLAGLDGFDPAI